MTDFFRTANPLAQCANHLVNQGFQIIHYICDQTVNYFGHVAIQISQDSSLNHAAVIASNLGIFLLADNLTNKLSSYTQKYCDFSSGKRNTFKKIMLDTIVFGSIIALLNHSLSMAFQYPQGKIALAAITISHIAFRYLIKGDIETHALSEKGTKELDLSIQPENPVNESQIIENKIIETQTIETQTIEIQFVDQQFQCTKFPENTSESEIAALEAFCKLKETFRKTMDSREKNNNKIRELNNFLHKHNQQEQIN